MAVDLQTMFSPHLSQREHAQETKKAGIFRLKSLSIFCERSRALASAHNRSQAAFLLRGKFLSLSESSRD
jgi:hypothetical protein